MILIHQKILRLLFDLLSIYPNLFASCVLDESLIHYFPYHYTKHEPLIYALGHASILNLEGITFIFSHFPNHIALDFLTFKVSPDNLPNSSTNLKASLTASKSAQNTFVSSAN